MSTKYKNLIFDMDNTLSDCSSYYEFQRDELGAFLSDRTGLSEDFIKALQRKIDVEFTSLSGGFSRSRFPRSFSATSVAIDVMLGNRIDEDSAEQSFLIGDAVFYAPYALYDGVFEMLSEYKKSFEVFLCSKGDYEVQMKKVIANNLLEIFPKDRIYIVDHKHPEDVLKIMSDHSLSPDETIFIGDSVRDDVGSAVGAGIDSVLITGDSTSFPWEYENQSHKPTFEIKSVKDLPTIIPIPVMV